MLIDSHCHIPHAQYDKSPDEVLTEARDAGVLKLITIGTSIKDDIETLLIAKQYENIYSSIGVYPTENRNKSLNSIEDSFEKLFSVYKNKIVAVGETGIEKPVDGFPKNYKNRNIQEQCDLFELHIKFALEKKLPIIIHNRNGNNIILELLTKYQGRGLEGVFHCFTGDWDFAQKVLALGFYISFSGIITFKNSSEDLIKVVRNVPADRYLIETDAPYLAPTGHRGEINYPKYVKITAEKVAELKNISFEEVAGNTYNNTCRLFSI